MFIKVTSSNRDGDIEPRTINLADIGLIKPSVNTPPAKTCISLLSQPSFPVWCIESHSEVTRLLKKAGVEIHGSS